MDKDETKQPEQMPDESASKTGEISAYYTQERPDILPYIPEDASIILEFGCGCGTFAQLIIERYGSEYWGVEICPEAAEIASKKLDKVLACDAAESINQLPDNYFDCIIFNDVLEHLADPYTLLKLLKIKFTDKGVIVASIPNVRYWTNFKKYILHGSWEYTEVGILDKTHLRFFTLSSIKNTFKNLGYEIITLDGLRPRRSKTLKLLNILFLGKLSDVKYLQFACVARPFKS